MNYLDKLQRNIPINYLYTFFHRFNISNTFWLLFLAHKGVPLVQIGLLESIYHISSLALEIPTGMIADLWGRRISMILGGIAGVLHCILMLYSDSFLGYALAFAVIALANVLNSGAQESLVYDSCLETGQEEKYKKIISNVYSILLSASALALLIGGVISMHSFTLLYIGGIVVQILVTITATFFTEPKIAHENRQKTTLIQQFTQSIGIVREVKRAKYLIIFYGVLFSMGTVFYFYCQQTFSESQLSRGWIGFIYAIDGLAGAIAARYAYRVEAKLKEKGLFILGILTIALNGLGLSLVQGVWGKGVFFISLAIGQSLVDPMFSDYLNRIIPSQQRATIISMQHAAFSAVMMVIFPLVGFIADKTSLSFAFQLQILVFIPVAILCYRKLNPRVDQSVKPEELAPAVK